MMMDENIWKRGERAVFALRALYQRYGYVQFKMSKFEEYDYYVRNKDFLVGEGVITFTDTDGKLLALKPDVTLSIVKNTQDEAHTTHKLYYNENVYRISQNTHTFKEIMQTGLECIGEIDIYAITEVALLAVKSLEAVSGEYMLDISHLGVLSALIGTLSVSETEKKKLIHCIGEKNPHGIREICAEAGADAEICEKLVKLVSIYGKPCDVLPALYALEAGEEAMKAVKDLETLTKTLENIGYGDRIHIDFSVVNDMNYYSGVVFKGFINGVPESVLSGGQYDKLMVKMGRTAQAVGFAVYLDTLEFLDDGVKEYDTDILLLYEDGTDVCELLKSVSVLAQSGNRITAQKSKPEAMRYRQLLAYRNGGLEILETND